MDKVETLNPFDVTDATKNLALAYKEINKIKDPERRSLFILALLNFQAVLYGQIEKAVPLPGELDPWYFSE